MTSFFQIVYYLVHEFWYLLILTLLGLHLLRAKKLKEKSLTLLTTFTFLFMVIPTVQWVAIHLESQYPQMKSLPSDIKGIIILGGSHDDVVSQARGKPSYNYAAGRILDALPLIRKHPNAQIIYSGGGGDTTSDFREARLFKEYMIELGFPLDRFIFEDKSLNTKENAEFCAEILKPLKGDKYALVTSALHMPRSVGLFKKAGFDVIPYPVDFKTTGSYDIRNSFVLWRASTLLRAVTHECLSLLRHKLKGDLA